MGSFEENYDNDALRTFTEKERVLLQELHQQLDDKFDEIAAFLAKALGLGETDPRAREEASEAIRQWEEVAEMAPNPEPPGRRGPWFGAVKLQHLLDEYHSIAEVIMNVQDEAIERSVRGRRPV
jgi:hypothetical protein